MTWVLQQVGSSAIVSCDPLVCMALAARGFPAGSLLQLGPTTPNPVGSAVVIATPAVRSQYGSQLESDYAPDVLASFGSGSSRIERPRGAHPAGPLLTRPCSPLMSRPARPAGAALLHNRNVTASATAASQLSAGQVDSRLLATLDLLARIQPIDIVAFGDSGPGASAGMPLRLVDLAEAARGALATGAAYLKPLQASLVVQRGATEPHASRPRSSPARLCCRSSSTRRSRSGCSARVLRERGRRPALIISIDGVEQARAPPGAAERSVRAVRRVPQIRRGLGGQRPQHQRLPGQQRPLSLDRRSASGSASRACLSGRSTTMQAATRYDSSTGSDGSSGRLTWVMPRCASASR